MHSLGLSVAQTGQARQGRLSPRLVATPTSPSLEQLPRPTPSAGPISSRFAAFQTLFRRFHTVAPKRDKSVNLRAFCAPLTRFSAQLRAIALLREVRNEASARVPGLEQGRRRPPRRREIASEENAGQSLPHPCRADPCSINAVPRSHAVRRQLRFHRKTCLSP